MRVPFTMGPQAAPNPRALTRACCLVALAILVSVPRVAAAQPAPPAIDPIATIEQELTRQAEALASASCPVACEALASMRRAADRICALDPGPRCAAARAKVRDATHKVEASCAECRSGGRDSVANEPKPQPPPPPPPSEPPRDLEQDKAANKGKSAHGGDAAPPPAPAAEAVVVSKRGGCAGCAVTGGEGAGGAGALAAIAIAALLARRRSRRAL
jgi:MYXO-CTERM domain-containing protein